MSEFSTIRIGSSMKSLDAPEELAGYSKVCLQVTGSSPVVEYTAGEDSGRTLTVSSPWATPEMAEDLLKRVQGYAYQPYTASGAIIDPACELGDAIESGDMHGGVYVRKGKYGRTMRADLSAPHTEEINEVTTYKSAEQRKITRQFQSLQSSLTIQASEIAAEVQAREDEGKTLRGLLSVQSDLIEAKVSSSGGGEGSESFGWELKSDGWTLKSGSTVILSADASGLLVKGTVEATSGKIGGFTIKDGYLSTNSQTWGGTNSSGIYIGSSGIQLGQNFRVDASGNLTAASGTFSGNVHAGNILYGSSGGTDYGTFSGGGITSGSITGTKVASSTLSSTNLTSLVNTNIGYGVEAYNVTKGYTQFGSLIGKYMSAAKISMNNKTLGTTDGYIASSVGTTVSWKYVKLVTWTDP